MDNATAADQLTQLSQELGMYDTQMDSVKRERIEYMIAQKLLETVSQDDLEDCYYEMQKEWAESLSEGELLEIARDLNVEI